MDIMIPIGLGFIINLLIFTVAKIFKQNNTKSLFICTLVFTVILVSSFMIGSWLGMGIGVISFGMLLFIILSVIILILLPRRKVTL